MLHRALALLSTAVVTVVISQFVLTQVALPQQGKNNAAPKGTAIKVAGTVDQVVPQGILVTGKDGKKYAVGFGPTSKVGLIGNASIDIIEAGAYVQATVDMDGQLNPMKPVSKLQVTERSAINEPGLFPEAGPDAKKGEPGKYFVRGTVKTNKGDTMSIQADKTLVTFKLAPGVVVPVTLSAWQLAQSGDQISGDGQSFAAMAAPGGPIPVLGEKIEIKAAQMITGKKGK